jgi:large subunit ribosomal protein L18
MPKIAIPKTRQEKRTRRHLRVRNTISGTAERPRLVVFRSLKHITAQLVDDTQGRTLFTVTSAAASVGGEGKKTEKSLAVGKRVAERAKEAGITRVVFDRAGYQYHGRVKAVADGAREGGLEF